MWVKSGRWRWFLSSCLLITAFLTTHKSTNPSPFWKEADHLQQSPVKRTTQRKKNLRLHKLSLLGKRQKPDLGKAPPAEWSSQVREEELLSNQDRLGRCCSQVGLCCFSCLFSHFFPPMKLIHHWDHVTTFFVPFGHKKKTCGVVKSSAFAPELFIQVLFLFSFSWSETGSLKGSFLVSVINNSVATKVWEKTHPDWKAERKELKAFVQSERWKSFLHCGPQRSQRSQKKRQ